MKDNPYSNKAAARVWQEGYMEACRDMEHWRKVRYGKRKDFLGDDIPMNMEIVFKIQINNKPRLFVGFRSRNRLYYYNGFFMLHDVGNVHWRYLFFSSEAKRATTRVSMRLEKRSGSTKITMETTTYEETLQIMKEKNPNLESLINELNLQLQ